MNHATIKIIIIIGLVAFIFMFLFVLDVISNICAVHFL
jgi:hypothetical protein